MQIAPVVNAAQALRTESPARREADRDFRPHAAGQFSHATSGQADRVEASS
jgi:hypothetical protein